VATKVSRLASGGQLNRTGA